MAKGKLPPLPAPPPVPVTKKKAAAPSSERGNFDQFINAHKALKPYAGQIWTYASFYGGITPTELAGLLWFESGGNPAAKSSVGALGLAQIYDNSASPTNDAGVPFFRADRNISAKDKTNPVFAIRYAAWRMSGAVQKYGSVDAAYLRDYNPGYKGSAAPISSVLPKGYVGTPSQTISTSVQKSVTTSQVKTTATVPWMVLTKRGQIKPVISSLPPKGTLTYGGQPVNESDYNALWNNTYRDTYLAYTGKAATGRQIAQIIASGISSPGLALKLSNEPGFQNSPVYKQHAQGFLGVGRSILGNTWNPSGDTKGIIKRAIVNNWDQSTFEQKLRESKEYLNSPEFKTNLAQNVAQYQSIFGNTDNATQAMLKQKTLDGWTPDQVGAWLRAQPAYKYSAEYQSKSLSFLGSLGLITGQQATLSDAQVNQLLASGDKIAAAQPNAVTNPANVTQPSPPPGTPPRIQPTPAGGIHVPGGTI